MRQSRGEAELVSDYLVFLCFSYLPPPPFEKTDILMLDKIFVEQSRRIRLPLYDHASDFQWSLRHSLLNTTSGTDAFQKPWKVTTGTLDCG